MRPHRRASATAAPIAALAAAFAAGLLGNACSGTDEATIDSSGASQTVAAAVETTTRLATATSSADTTTSPTPPTTTRASESPATTEVLSFTGDPNSEWCAAAAELVVLSDAFEQAWLTDPVELEQTLSAFVDRMSLIAFIAPSEIVDDVALSVDAFGAMRGLLEEADFNLEEVDLSPIESNRDVLEVASTRIATYNRDVCGIDPGAVASTTPSPPVGSTATSVVPNVDAVRQAAVELLIDGGYTTAEAECIVTAIQQGLPTQDVLSECGLTLDGPMP